MITLLANANLAQQIGGGTIQGGWEYVWGAYGLTWGALALYGLSLWLRRKGADAAPENDR